MTNDLLLDLTSQSPLTSQLHVPETKLLGADFGGGGH